MKIPMNSIDRFRGSLIGLAIGDALGATLEFKAPGTFESVTNIVGGGPFNLRPGEWTDDTSMALCLAESLIKCNGFSAADQMERYVRWYRDGYMSSKGICFDIGMTTRESLESFEITGEPFSGSTDPWSAGNGSLMRLAPVPLFFSKTPELAVTLSGKSSMTTHGATEAVDACRFYGGLIVGAVLGFNKEELLSPGFSPIPELWGQHQLASTIRAVAEGSYKEKQPPAIKGAGYVVSSLEAALWAFYHGKTFEEGLLLAVNLGDDADTTGAIYGQLAGAYFGIDAIPNRWIEKIVQRAEIQALADELHKKYEES
ncbi:ADP-ribosylglycohydrolase [Aneurinibacillus aneurinilyticus ATCC 12856]|uniref:ADP-ribosylglycohydrolase n=4 Tax=Aneurinibacillus aneurinilyticus TaxID=1391 RepID=U1YF38_ANEAE|nr:ADP-ribosylglycohydrolase [Aneurinibacillus aneurinilyticus ATCC 12856]